MSTLNGNRFIWKTRNHTKNHFTFRVCGTTIDEVLLLCCSLLLALFKHNIVVVENMLSNNKAYYFGLFDFLDLLNKASLVTRVKKRLLSKSHHLTTILQNNCILKEWRKCCSFLAPFFRKKHYSSALKLFPDMSDESAIQSAVAFKCTEFLQWILF